MLDMKQAWDRMIERYSPDRATARRILRNPLYQRITDSFVGSHEYAAIEALYELHDAGEYDCIVVDTPPSRNALDFLEAPPASPITWARACCRCCPAARRVSVSGR